MRRDAGKAFRYTGQDVAPHLQSLLVKLFTLIETRGDNEYLMKCVLRVVAVAKQQVVRCTRTPCCRASR
jgi:hypothetical protein